jgi:hypothetical protein
MLSLTCGHPHPMATASSDSGASTVTYCGPCLTAAMSGSPVVVTCPDRPGHVWWSDFTGVTATVLSAGQSSGHLGAPTWSS